jgi:hypothetical protein
MGTSIQTPLAAFDRLSLNVWYSEQSALSPNETEPSGKSPDLIVLCTWMGGVSRPVAKYVAGYQILYSKSSILLIRNEVKDIMIRSKAHAIKQLQPALTVIEKFAETTSPRILLHVMSNGGCIMSRNLAEMYVSRHSKPLPISSMVLDSCPGIEGFQSALAAFSFAMPKFLPLRLLFSGLFYAALACMYLVNKTFRLDGPITRLRKDLNNDKLYPKRASRVYIYSRNDKLVEWEVVEKHAEDAKKKGWKVKMEEFKESQHVAHLMADGERYWSDVEEVVSS